MVQLLNSLITILGQNMLWIVFLVMFIVESKKPLGWTTSIRSIATMVVTFVFAQMAVVEKKIEAKDIMLIVSLVYNFYFLVKSRMDTVGGLEKKPPVT